MVTFWQGVDTDVTSEVNDHELVDRVEQLNNNSENYIMQQLQNVCN